MDGESVSNVDEIREAMVRLATDKQERARMGAIARDTALATKHAVTRKKSRGKVRFSGIPDRQSWPWSVVSGLR